MVVNYQRKDFVFVIYLDGRERFRIIITQEDWRTVDIYDNVFKPEIDNLRALAASARDVGDRFEYDVLAKVLERFARRWQYPPEDEKPVPAAPVKYVDPATGLTGLPDSEIPKNADWPQTVNIARKPEVVARIEKQLWPIPEAIAAINTKHGYRKEDECLWARAELIAGLARWRAKMAEISGNEGTIAINSAYRRLGTTAARDTKYEDGDGYIDEGDNYGHWTGYCVDASPLITGKRFGLFGDDYFISEQAIEAAISVGLTQPHLWKGEIHHFRPDFK